MSFNPIILTQPAAATYNEAGRGVYLKSTVTFGGPVERIKLSPASLNKQSKSTSGSIQLYTEYDYVLNGVTSREWERVVFQIEASKNGRVSQIDNSIIALSEFVNAGMLNRWLNGEF